jgi:hypothetical protein
MRIAIVGSREYPKLDLVRSYVRSLEPGTVVISGGAKGVDSEAEKQARDFGLEVVVYPADWNRYGKTAGFVRNRTIVEDADRVVAFWDGDSRGTINTISLAVKMGKSLEIIGPK